MNTKHRFNRDEISNILKRAAELEHKDNVRDDSDGLTVEELQQVSKEVGLHPKYIRLAAEELEQPSRSVIASLIGGPFKYQYSNVVKGSLPDEKWEEIVSEIRRFLGSTGKPSKFGKTFEWELREGESENVHLFLSPQKGHTTIRVQADFKDYAAVIYGAIGTMGIAVIAILIPILFKKAGLPLTPLLISGGIGILSFAAGLRFYLTRWMNKKRKTYRSLVQRLQEMLGSEKEEAPSTSIVMPEPEEPEISEASTGSRNKEKTK